MDHLEAVGNLLYLYGLTELPSLPREMHELVNVLDQQAKITADAMPRLRSMKNLEEYWIEINRLENDGDRAYRMLLVRLFSGEYDALTVLKMKEVTPHDLRATHATWAADTHGVMVAARRLRHTDASVTTRHYARPVGGRHAEVARHLDKLGKPARRHRVRNGHGNPVRSLHDR
jgi:integrase